MGVLDIPGFQQSALPGENAIMAPWSYAEPLVSVVCITFNHEKYIEDAIRGILMQKTDFPFELVIHDDASTDATQEIIRHYVKAYPNLIRPIFQAVNQKKSGKRMFPLAVKYAKGQYVALCEGDDYWLCEEKLQLQIKALRKHPESDLCFHAAVVLHHNGELTKMANHSDVFSIFSVDKVISADGSFCPTASLVLKRSVFDTLPSWFYDKAPVGDYYLKVLGSLSGGALFLPFEMSLYRSLVPGSWSESLYQKEKNSINSYFERTIDCLSELDKYTDLKYSASIKRAKSLQAFSIAILFLKKKGYREFKDFIQMSWNYSRFLVFSQILVLAKKMMIRAIGGRIRKRIQENSVGAAGNE